MTACRSDCADWMCWGLVESNNHGDVNYASVQTALLSKNTRRNVTQPILLTSNNGKHHAFTTITGLSSMAKEVSIAVPPPAEAPCNTCTDFTLVGYVESMESIPLANVAKALLENKITGSPVTLTSNNARCDHFVTDGFCSAPLTSKDVLWMESVANCKKGVLF